jgi:hypothetical protein
MLVQTSDETAQETYSAMYNVQSTTINKKGDSWLNANTQLHSINYMPMHNEEIRWDKFADGCSRISLVRTWKGVTLIGWRIIPVGRNISGGCDILMKNAQGKKKELTLAPGEMDISFFFFGVCGGIYHS